MAKLGAMFMFMVMTIGFCWGDAARTVFFAVLFGGWLWFGLEEFDPRVRPRVTASVVIVFFMMLATALLLLGVGSLPAITAVGALGTGIATAATKYLAHREYLNEETATDAAHAVNSSRSHTARGD